METPAIPFYSVVQFYSYMWLREKDTTFPAGTPYYVGKGNGNRAFDKRGHRCRLPKNLSNIVVFPMRSEKDAFKSEVALIQLFGRANNGTGCLRNLTDGGEGATGYRHTCEMKRRMRENALEQNRVHGAWSPEARARNRARRGASAAARFVFHAIVAALNSEARRTEHLRETCSDEMPITTVKGKRIRHQDVADRIFGRLTAKKYVGRFNCVSWWKCLCTCGETKVVSVRNLVNGTAKSCGCISREQALTNPPIFDKENKKVISVLFELDKLKSLERIASQEKTSKADLIRSAVDQLIRERTQANGED